MQEIGEHVIRREVGALEEQRQGLVLITVGNVLLGMDLLLACFVYSGLQAGSYMFLWWVLGEGVLGLGMVGVGSHKKSDARRKIAELTPSQHG
jgi:pheromone shutdown protein TraB